MVDMLPPAPERLARAERIYLRSLLLIPEGILQRRAARTRKVTAIVFVICMWAIVVVVRRNSWPLGAAILGLVAGASAVFWIMARSTTFRAPVIMRVCNWDRVKELLAERPEA